MNTANGWGWWKGVAFILLLLTGWCRVGLAYTLSGTVYGGNSPLAGANVEAVDEASGLSAGSSVSNGSGLYGLNVGSGSYRLTVTAPAQAGYADATVNGVVVNGADTSSDIFLIPKKYVLSGAVRTASGNPVPAGVYVYVATVGFSTEGSTDAQGRYSLSVPAGTYRLGLSVKSWHKLDGSDYLSGDYFDDSAVASIPVAGNTTQDVQLPAFVRLTGKTVDSNGNAIGAVRLEMTDYLAVPKRFDAGNNLYSDAAGNFALLLLPGTYGFTLIPPNGTLASQTTVAKFPVTVDTVHNLVLNGGYRITGVVRTAAGTPISGANVYAGTSSTATDAQGRYSLSVAPGSTSIGVTAWNYYPLDPGDYPAGNAWFYHAVPALDVQSNVTQDIQLPAFARISGRTVDASGNPVPNVGIEIPAVYGSEIRTDTAHASSDANGNFSFLMPNGTYRLNLGPSAGGSTVATAISNVVIAGDTVRDLVLDGGYTLTGTIRNAQGEPLPDVYVYAAMSGFSAEGFSNQQGIYTLSVRAGTYRMGIGFQNWHSIGGGEYLSGDYWDDAIATDVSVQGKTTQDLQLPNFIRIAGKTTDSNGVPVRNIGIGLSIKAWAGIPKRFDLRDTVATSSKDGRYTLLVPAGTYQLSIKPPAASGFVGVSLPSIDMTADKSQTVILDLPDSRPPVIVAGPLVSHITDAMALISWQTDEPATGAVNVGGQTISETGKLRTDHAVLLTGLSASTPYLAEAASSDAAGNGPATRTTSFTTLAQADTQSPLIVGGPVVYALSPTSALVEWTTNEPSDNYVSYGTTPSVGTLVGDNLVYTSEHRMELTGLSPDTPYFLAVQATDTLGNGPSQSAIVSFRTPALPDTAAPTIIRGPLVIDVTSDSATVVWVTDEAATSGVSYNDGSAFGVTKDDALTTEHVVRLSGLTADTAYTVVVSSKDQAGNGPTLSPEIPFHTLALQDTQGPVLTEGPIIVNITHQSVVIRWTTDELADAVIRYGTRPDRLDQIESKAQLITHHNLAIVGLSNDTDYYFTVQSTDAAGNPSALSEVMHFKTDALKREDKPVWVKAPTVVHEDKNSITLEWDTDRPMSFEIRYGEDADKRESKSSGQKSTHHQVTFAKLKGEQTYHFSVRCRDDDDNELSTDN